MGARIRDLDWAETPLGPIHDWPQSLRSALSIGLRSGTPTAVCWGADFRFLYNDAWAPLLGDRHPWALGRPVSEVMADIWPMLEDQFQTAYEEAQAVNLVDTLLPRNLNGRSYDSWWSYSLLPVAGEDGTIAGVLGQARDRTGSVLRARRDHLLLEIAEKLRGGGAPDDLMCEILALVGEHLGVSRTGFGETDAGGETFTIQQCWTDGSVADISGRYPVGHWNRAAVPGMLAGQPIMIADGEEPGLLSDELRERWRSIGCRAALVVPLVFDGHYSAVIFAHDKHPREWSEEDRALLAAVSDRLWQYLSRTRAEAALRRSEERYRRIFEQANDLIITADLDQVITDCNPAAAAAIERERGEIIGRSIRDFVSPEGFEQTSKMLRQKVEKGGTTRHSLDVYTRSGGTRHWEINSALTVDPSGKPIGLHAIGRDVTERRRAEERQKILVNELNHRVKNTLAVVQGIALQSFSGRTDPAQAREAFQQRLAALATAHDLLTRESWEGATLAELVEHAVGHLDRPETRIHADGPAVTLGPKAAVSLIMALHELATNAAKYGALSTPAGRVSLRWAVEGDELTLEWREQGGPPVEAPTRRGFGLKMIERVLAADLAGGATVEFEREGLVCRIQASLTEACAKA